MEIIIKGKVSMGKTRSEQETNIRKEWGSTMNDGQLDKTKFLEKKAKQQLGMKQSFIKLTEVDKVE